MVPFYLAPPAGSVPSTAVEPHRRYADIHTERIPDELADMTAYPEDQSWVFTARNGIRLKIELFSAEVIRIKFDVGLETDEECPYALDPELEKETIAALAEETDEEWIISTGVIQCHIAKRGLMTSFLDEKDGNLICRDAIPFYARNSAMHGREVIMVTRECGEEEHFYGLGDKTCNLNLRGQRKENWCSDSFGFDRDMDPLYRSIPFYYGLREGKGYGIFLNNSYRSYFDFNALHDGKVRFGAWGGEMEYFFIYGPALTEVARRYAWLTGLPELPPLWSLGFHQCRWSYYPESRVREVAAEFRRRNIPCDALYLDIDYMDGYRCFTWNRDHFPDPAAMIAGLKESGFRTVVMIDPGIRVDENYEVYKDGFERNLFCRRTSGELMTGPVWPPKCVWPDYTDPKVRQWWGDLYRELYLDHGIDGFWNDMNEPAVFQISRLTFPLSVAHHYEGQGGDHSRAHNVYGMQMSRASWEGLKRLHPEKRPFLLTRATFAGGQRFAALWTGDNYSTWEHLRLANLQCQRLSLSGFSLVGTDIGGFAGAPDGELMVRWLQLGVFHPVFRVHSMGNNEDGASGVDNEKVLESESHDRLDQEPWSYGEPHTTFARKAIEMRYQLLPYLYTAFYDHCTTGQPVIRSLSFFAQNDPQALEREHEFLFGEHLLVAPVLLPGVKTETCYLPEGRWYDYFTGRLHVGGYKHHFRVYPDRIPVYAREGAVIPNFPVQQFTGEKTIDKVTLRVFCGPELESRWYEDAGEGYDHEEGAYRLHRFSLRMEEGRVTLVHTMEGEYDSPCKTFRLMVAGLPFRPTVISVDGKERKFPYSRHNFQEVEVNAGFEEVVIG